MQAQLNMTNNTAATGANGNHTVTINTFISKLEIWMLHSDCHIFILTLVLIICILLSAPVCWIMMILWYMIFIIRPGGDEVEFQKVPALTSNLPEYSVPYLKSIDSSNNDHTWFVNCVVTWPDVSVTFPSQPMFWQGVLLTFGVF